MRRHCLTRFPPEHAPVPDAPRGRIPKEQFGEGLPGSAGARIFRRHAPASGHAAHGRGGGSVRGADLSVISQKMANTVSASIQLQKTYLPVNRSTVELADEACKRGPRHILENKMGMKIETLCL